MTNKNYQQYIWIFLKKYHFALLLFLLVLLAVFLSQIQRYNNTPHFTTPASLADKDTAGTPPRVEREYKLKLSGEWLGYYAEEEIVSELQQAVKEAIAANGFSVPKMINQEYMVDDDISSFLFFDIYFDTPEGYTAKNDISYRMRERFDNRKVFNAYLSNQQNTSTLPYRLEYQAKVGRTSTDGFSEVEEARFEFRQESTPFSADNPPPQAPWKREEFISYLERGIYPPYYLEPTKHVIKTLQERGDVQTAYTFQPYIVVITDRHRFHIQMKTPWGSGPNPEQTFIVTLDHFWAYDANEYLAYMDMANTDPEQARKPALLGDSTEIEIEFERNVSTKLDEAIFLGETYSERERLKFVRDAFLADQKSLATAITEQLQAIHIDVTPAEQSKYIQAVAMKKSYE